MAFASSIFSRGLLRTLSNSSSLLVMGNRWTWNVSAPTSDRIALVTYAFMPWMRDTTAMIDVTATMFPSTVKKDRSLLAQIAFSAIPAASKNWFTASSRCRPARGPVVRP